MSRHWPPPVRMLPSAARVNSWSFARQVVNGEVMMWSLIVHVAPWSVDCA